MPFDVSDRVVSTFEKQPTPLHALKRNMNPTRSLQNNREQSQKWNVKERKERAGWKGQWSMSSKHMRTHNKNGEWGQRVKAWGAQRKKRDKCKCKGERE